MREPKLLLLLVLAAALVSSPSHAQPASVTGTWTGTVAQNVGKTGYTVVMTLTATGGTTDYPELKCGGQLTRVATSGDYVFFAEKITRGGTNSGGSCIDGFITVAPGASTLAWGWFANYRGSPALGWSTLKRK